MSFVLTCHYIALTDLAEIRQGQEFRVTGFDFKDNILLKLVGTETTFKLPKSLHDFFVLKTPELQLALYIPPPEGDYLGTKQSDVMGYFEGQKTTLTCWASCLSNVLMAIQKPPYIFIGEHDIVELLNASASSGGPNHEEFFEAIETTLRSNKLPFAVEVHEAGKLLDWQEITASLSAGRPVICSVNRRSHVVILLAHTSAAPAWLLYFEPTGGSFKRIAVQRFLSEKNPDWAYSFADR